MSYFFRFESEQERNLAIIPMMVRMKLDTSGVKLSLDQWNRLPEPERRRLFEQPCDNEVQARNYRELLIELVACHSGAEVRLLEVPLDLPWLDGEWVPTQIIRQALAVGVDAPSRDQWRRLTAAQRFALLKLTRDGRESPHYLPALREFELI